MATNVNIETGLIGVTPKYKFHDQVTVNTGDTIQDVSWSDCEYLAKFKKNSLGPMIVRPDYIYEDTAGNLARNGVTIVGVSTENTLARVTDPEVLRVLLDNVSHTLEGQIRLAEVASGSIGAAWFAGNTKIEVFDCPRGYSVAASAFNGCTGLKEVFIQKNVSLGNSAFNGCSHVECYHFLDTNVGSFGTTVFNGLSGTCYLYVPNEAVVNYCKVSNLGTYINRIRGHIKGWHLICADGTYKYNLRDCYDTATNISFRLEGTYVTNLSLSVDPDTYEATVTVTGMLPDTDEDVELVYGFDYRNHHFSGYVPLHLKTGAAEIIEFEDPEVKRICVANWGGIYRMSLDGYEGEMTKEQAAKVSSIGTTFKNNTKIGKFNEFQYFTSLVNFTNTYAVNSPFSGSSLVEIDLRNVNTMCEQMFGACRSLKKLNNIKPTVRLTCTSNGSGPFIRCSSLETKLYLANATYLAGTSVSSTISVSLFREIGSPEIWIPKSISSISAGYVFYNSTRLTTIVITRDSSIITLTDSNIFSGLASGAKVYVPNDLVINYRKASYWANIYTRILPIIEGPSVIYGNGTYSFVPNTPFTGFTDMTWELEENDYLTLTTEQDGSATVTASGMITDTNVTVQLGYSFEYDGNEVSGTINIPVEYKEVIDFEDEEVKRICVNNWGGKYGVASKVPGVPGELTYEQAAEVTSIGTAFKGNKIITEFKEFAYFTKVNSLAGSAFEGCTKLKYLDVPPSVASAAFSSIRNNPAMVWIIFRRTASIVTVSGNNALHTVSGYVYVPDDLLDDYLAYKNWGGQYPTKFKALSTFIE